MSMSGIHSMDFNMANFDFELNLCFKLALNCYYIYLILAGMLDEIPKESLNYFQPQHLFSIKTIVFKIVPEHKTNYLF